MEPWTTLQTTSKPNLTSIDGHLQVVKYLVQHVEDIHPKNVKQKTPLDYSIECKHSAVENFIVEHDEHLSALARLNQVKLDENSGVACAGAEASITASEGAEAVIEATAPPWPGPEAVIEATAPPWPGPETLETAKEDNECTICFELRNQTFMFYPCGHATFCKDCAFKLFEHEDKKCPDCRRQIQDTIRVYQ